MNGIKSCCGFGHRQVFENLSEQLYETVYSLAEQGCEIFYTGAMGDFDNMFSSSVRRIKRVFPNVKLICVKPYMTKEINEYGDYLYTLYDDILIPTELVGVHYKSAITKRNHWIISQSDLVIVYITRNYGGAYNALKFARSENKYIILLND